MDHKRSDPYSLIMVCPANTAFMPYAESYLSVLRGLGVAPLSVIWDRLGDEPVSSSSVIYKDGKTGTKRGVFDYVGFSEFVRKTLRPHPNAKVIVFGIPTAFFIRRSLLTGYPSRYILDIRDYHKVGSVYPLAGLIGASAMTVISSPGYREWLPSGFDFVVDHNTQGAFFKEAAAKALPETLRISYIGALRDFPEQKALIDVLGNRDDAILEYHGFGEINKRLQHHIIRQGVVNASITGRYSKGEERNLYANCDLVNVVISGTSKNSRTLLPNRLYQAVAHRKPVLTLGGTYLARVVETWGLGLVLRSLNDAANELRCFRLAHNPVTFERNCWNFAQYVMRDKAVFEEKLKCFASPI